MNKKRKQYHGKPGTKSLNIIRQYFPKVNELIDAKKPSIIEVTEKDTQSTDVKNPALCAFARACYRSFKADGVIIGLKTSYVIKGKTAIRFINTETLSREIVVFDRKGKFYIGRYQISPPCPAARLGAYKGRPTHPKNKNGQDRRLFRHFTEGVRVLSHTTQETR